GEAAAGASNSHPVVRGDGARIVASDVPWLRPGDTWWMAGLARPGFLVEGKELWLAVPEGRKPVAKLLRLSDPGAPWLQELADRTGYTVGAVRGQKDRSRRGIRIETRTREDPDPEEPGIQVRPRDRPSPGRGLWDSEWIRAFYLETARNAAGEDAETGRNVAVLSAATSPRVLFDQLFTQGVPEIGRVFWVVFLSIAGALLFVYLVALSIAFVLVGTIVRNVNRLTRATEAISHGDFSMRINSKSRDQIGDLARSFDHMAASIQNLLQETALKEKLEAELAVARAIQESLLPESGGSWKGFQAAAHFEPAADLGGDYYDILPMPDGRTAVTIGDVAGHGLPTGLVAAAARASLASFIELGVPASEAFARLGQRARRARDSERRLYTTLTFFAYDAGRRVGTLTNAGHPAPYRVSRGRVERLELPALPIGLLPGRDIAYPSKDFPFAPGDRLVLFTDGIVEAANAEEEPWGYERLEALLAREADGPADELVRSVLAAVAAHVGPTPLEDDRTLLILTFDAA
ncbi:MAG: PP2C family protein-serine/threonine phosphatase, partial [Thermoanaerobaculia bacterium]